MARYGKKAQDKVERAMHEMKRGELKSGRSGKKVTNPRQAVAIGLSEAREEGQKFPPQIIQKEERVQGVAEKVHIAAHSNLEIKTRDRQFQYYIGGWRSFYFFKLTELPDPEGSVATVVE
jgi:hypothetical protein